MNDSPIHVILVAVALALVAAFGTAEAQTPCNVNPTTASWNAPTTNADGSALADLAGYNYEVSLSPTSGFSSAGTKASPTPSPAPNTTVSVPVSGFNTAGTIDLTRDRKYYFRVNAVDTALNQSVFSPSVCWEVNRVAPSTPVSVQLGPPGP